MTATMNLLAWRSHQGCQDSLCISYSRIIDIALMLLFHLILPTTDSTSSYSQRRLLSQHFLSTILILLMDLCPTCRNGHHSPGSCTSTYCPIPGTPFATTYIQYGIYPLFSNVNIICPICSEWVTKPPVYKMISILRSSVAGLNWMTS